MLEFRWDDAKAAANRQKHKVAFDEGAEAFLDPRSLLKHDPDHSDAEDRWILTGMSLKNRALTVVFAQEGDTIRLISARRATMRERNEYEQAHQHFDQEIGPPDEE